MHVSIILVLTKPGSVLMSGRLYIAGIFPFHTDLHHRKLRSAGTACRGTRGRHDHVYGFLALGWIGKVVLAFDPVRARAHLTLCKTRTEADALAAKSYADAL